MTSILVNLFAGPGASKSTTRAWLFSILKRANVNAEEITEYAKELVWEERHIALSDQVYVFGKMHRNTNRLLDKVDVIVTDSPIVLSEFYAKPNTYPDSFHELVWDTFKGNFNNRAEMINIFLQRNKPYNPAGRLQTEDQARELDSQIAKMLHSHDISFANVLADQDSAWLIALMVGNALEKNGKPELKKAIFDLVDQETRLDVWRNEKANVVSPNG